MEEEQDMTLFSFRIKFRALKEAENAFSRKAMEKALCHFEVKRRLRV
jgi:hypothetical protein